MPDVTAKLDELREQVFAGQLTRRDVLRRGAALGLSAPLIAGLLAACGDDDEDPTATSGAAEPTATTSDSGQAEATATEAGEEPTEAGEEPTEAAGEPTATEEAAMGPAGGGGRAILLYWQAPVILNPHIASGTKDFHASRVTLEPLFELDDNLEPIWFLAVEPWPTVENGQLAEDGTWVIWNLRQGVKWHDGEDFNAEDVVFTYEFTVNPDSTATTMGVYIGISSVEAIDDYTVRVNFTEPKPDWWDPFSRGNGQILAEHVYRDYIGTASRDAPANLMQIGTGPYMVREFNPGDTVIYDLFPDYWDAGLPYFDEIEIKGGGDAVSAARAVLQTGDADWAWNLQIEPQILDELVAAGAGQLNVVEGTGGTERLMLNFADPRVDTDGAFAELATPHPILTDLRIRQAIALACPRDVIAEQLYGEAGGSATATNFNEPQLYNNPNLTWEYDLEAAQALLDEAGFTGFDILYQTSVNAVRQKHQEIIKQNLEELGFSVEIKAVDAAIYFSSDAGNPDTASHFYADFEMHTNGPGPYPAAWAERYRSDDIAQKANNWSGSNVSRYQNPDWDLLHDQARIEIDVDTQIELWQEMMQIIWDDAVEIPQVARNSLAAMSNRIQGNQSMAWTSNPVWGLKWWTTNE